MFETNRPGTDDHLLTVRVVDRALVPKRFALLDRLLEGIEHELGGHGGGDAPAHDPAREDIDHEGDVDGARPSRHVSKV